MNAQVKWLIKEQRELKKFGLRFTILEFLQPSV